MTQRHGCVNDFRLYPVTGWVGQGVASPRARVSLNRIYSEMDHENLQLQGGEQLTLWSYGGQLGNYVNIQKLPQPAGVERSALPDTSYLIRGTGYSLDLKIDLNVVGMPVYSRPGFTSYSLLLFLKEKAGGDVEEIKRYNSETGSWETASWFASMPAGEDFEIKAGEAFLIYMIKDLNVRFDGVAHGAAIDLAPGLNMVSLPAAESGFVYSSYDMLEDLGDATEVSHIKGYDATGWQTTAWLSESPAGALYETKRGKGYLIYMKEAQQEWRPY